MKCGCHFIQHSPCLLPSSLNCPVLALIGPYHHPSYVGQDDDTSVARSENEHAGPSGPSGLTELSRLHSGVKQGAYCQQLISAPHSISHYNREPNSLYLWIPSARTLPLKLWVSQKSKCLGIVWKLSHIVWGSYVWVPMSEVPMSHVWAPTSELPMSELPTSELPTSELPTSELPTSEIPTSEVPTSELPTSQVPMSEVPTCAQMQWLVGDMAWNWGVAVVDVNECHVVAKLQPSLVKVKDAAVWSNCVFPLMFNTQYMVHFSLLYTCMKYVPTCKLNCYAIVRV